MFFHHDNIFQQKSCFYNYLLFLKKKKEKLIKEINGVYCHFSQSFISQKRQKMRKLSLQIINHVKVFQMQEFSGA